MLKTEKLKVNKKKFFRNKRTFSICLHPIYIQQIRRKMNL